jgi:hypothetical protein
VPVNVRWSERVKHFTSGRYHLSDLYRQVIILHTELHFRLEFSNLQARSKSREERHVRLSACINSAPAGRIFVKFCIGDFRKYVEISKFI